MYFENDEVAQELFELIKERSFKKGLFMLASGQTSTQYFNLKPTLLSWDGAQLTASLMMDMMCDHLQYETNVYVGGMAVGAVPMVASICTNRTWRGSYYTRKFNGLFVRKEVKEHGTRQLIEGLASGESIEGKNIQIVEDVCTTGGSILQAVQAFRDAGAIVKNAFTIVERGGREELEKSDITLYSIFKAEEFND